MRIDGTAGAGPQGLPEDKAWASKSRPTAGPAGPELTPDDPQVRYLHGKYSQQACLVNEIDDEAITEARRLLRTGQLDTPQAIRRAAEAILALGL